MTRSIVNGAMAKALPGASEVSLAFSRMAGSVLAGNASTAGVSGDPTA
jgi:hypothetical protein